MLPTCLRVDDRVRHSDPRGRQATRKKRRWLSEAAVLAAPTPTTHGRSTMGHHPLLPILVLAFASVLPAQRLLLPGGTGGIDPGPEWVVLRKAELEMATRATDPKSGHALELLNNIAIDTRAKGTVDRTLVLHSTDAGGHFRMVHCGSEGTSLPASELTRGNGRATVEKAITVGLAKVSPQSRFLGSDLPGLWPNGCLRLRFRLEREGGPWRQDLYVVPAGPMMQYFATYNLENDETGAEAIEKLLRTYDGARDPERSTNWDPKIGVVFGAGMLLVSVFVMASRGRTRAEDERPRRRRRRAD